MAGRPVGGTEAQGREAGEKAGGGRRGNDLLENAQLRGIDEEGRLIGGTHGGPTKEHRVEGEDVSDLDVPEAAMGPQAEGVGPQSAKVDQPVGRRDPTGYGSYPPGPAGPFPADHGELDQPAAAAGPASPTSKPTPRVRSAVGSPHSPMLFRTVVVGGALAAVIALVVYARLRQ